jgi:TPP-dependent 2-oxoacid decarboxylase
MPTTTVGKYLATRLEEIGLKHYFMVPGDYNLVLLDELLSNKNVEQIGCCNELNASYAAEGYARVNGCGAVVTTFNVGAFSALNGVAGENAERLPVIFVSAGYNTNDPSRNHLLHHTIGTHDFSYQHEMFEKITCAAVRVLHPDNAPTLIDHPIGTALRERKPAYIEIACNLSNAPCPEPASLETLGTTEASVGWTALPDRQRLINVEARSVRLPESEYTDVTMADFPFTVAKNVQRNDATLIEYERTNRGTKTEARPDKSTASLTRAEMCRQIEAHIDAKTTLLVETGDAKSLKRRGGPRPGAQGHHGRRAGQRDQDSPGPQGRPRPDRVPDRPRRLHYRTAHLGQRGGAGQCPPPSRELSGQGYLNDH